MYLLLVSPNSLPSNSIRCNVWFAYGARWQPLGLIALPTLAMIYKNYVDTMEQGCKGMGSGDRVLRASVVVWQANCLVKLCLTRRYSILQPYQKALPLSLLGLLSLLCFVRFHLSPGPFVSLEARGYYPSPPSSASRSPSIPLRQAHGPHVVSFLSKINK